MAVGCLHWPLLTVAVSIGGVLEGERAELLLSIAFTRPVGFPCLYCLEAKTASLLIQTSSAKTVQSVFSASSSTLLYDPYMPTIRACTGIIARTVLVLAF